MKYQWYTDKSGDGIKLYFQQKTVTYADYRAGLWYVSPYEVKIGNLKQIEKVPEEAEEEWETEEPKEEYEQLSIFD